MAVVGTAASQLLLLPLLVLLAASAAAAPASRTAPFPRACGPAECPFRDTSLPVEARLDWLMANLSTAEKVGLFRTQTRSIDRLVRSAGLGAIAM
eukprot:COSAG06_NODE_2262_length_7212_cov_7.977928_3_plen_95_part_00